MSERWKKSILLTALDHEHVHTIRVVGMSEARYDAKTDVWRAKLPQPDEDEEETSPKTELDSDTDNDN